MMGRIQANTVTKVFRVQIQREEEQVPQLAQKERQMAERGAANKSEEENLEQEAAERAGQRRGQRGGQRARGGGGGGAAAEKQEPVRRERPKVGRNDPCPCGSGKKYKKCHGKDEEAAASE